MTILELFFAFSVNDFTVPDHKEIVDTAECKNILDQYFEMKEKTGEPYVNIQ